MSLKRARGDPVIQQEGEPVDGPPRKKACQIAPAKNWCFTWHFEEDPPEVDWEALPGVAGGIVGNEVGSQTERKHLQGYLQFESKTRPFSLGLPKCIHWEAAKGTPEQNYKYCSKEKILAVWGVTKQAAGNPPLKLITDLRPWQASLLQMLLEDPDDRTIVWVHERAGGTGKSAFCKLLCAKHNAIICDGRAEDMKFQLVQMKLWPRIVVFNLTRTKQKLDYSGVEQIKDGCFASSKYESGMVLMNSPHLVVFSNAPPDWLNVSLDRWRCFTITDMELVPMPVPEDIKQIQQDRCA